MHAYKDVGGRTAFGTSRREKSWTDLFRASFNYSTGFNPQRATSQGPDSGGPFAPEHGRLLELGGKVDLFDDRLYLQLAAYQINKINVLVADPTPDAPSGRLTPIGEARSRGLERDLVGDISDNWTFTFSYGFNDTVILAGAGASINSSIASQAINRT